LAYYSRRDDEFAKRKIKNLAEQEERLKRDYRQLKYIESKQNEMQYAIERYIRSGQSLDDLLASAKSRATQQKNAREYER
jgi:hypothetical protein